MIRGTAKRWLQAFTRRRSVVQFADPLRTVPISREFGIDRGTPIDRAYIERFLAAHRERIHGRVLEIGDDRYTRAFGREVTRSAVIDVAAGHDLTKPSSLPDGAIDCVICTQTLNTIFDVQAAILGLRRIVDSGSVLVTVPGISQISRYDMDRWGDYWRFTEASLRRLFEPQFHEVAITSYGNVAAAAAFLQGIAVEDLPDRSVLDAFDRDYPVILGVVARG